MKKSVYYLLKIIILVGMIALLYFSAHFWLGTKEAWDEQVKEHFVEFWFSRLAFTLFVGVTSFSFSFLVDWIFRKTVIRKQRKAAMEILLILILSLVFVSLAVNK